MIIIIGEGGEKKPNAMDTVIIATLADSIAGFLTNPFDVIKVCVYIHVCV